MSVILDRRLAELWQRRASLTDVVERALLAQVEALGTTDLRVGDSAGSSFTPPRPQMLPLSIKVKSPEYAAMMKAVEDRGVTDAPVVAEASSHDRDSAVDELFLVQEREHVITPRRVVAAGAEVMIFRRRRSVRGIDLQLRRLLRRVHFG